MGRSSRRLVIAVTIVALVGACGGSDSTSDPVETAVTGATDSAAPTQPDEAPSAAADPVAVEACLENSGLRVRNQDEVDRPYSEDELDFFELETELLVEGGESEFISGGISFYRTIERAEEQEANFEDSVTDYTVGRDGTVVYALVGGTAGGELDEFVDTLDRCLAGG